MKILIPVDSSANSVRAVEYGIAYAATLKVAPEIFLINVQWKMAVGHIKLFINQETINEYYREQGVAALAQARAKMEEAGIAYTFHISVGTPAEAIVLYAQEHKMELIMMSAHGEDSLASLLLGSVAGKVVQLAKTSVLLVK